MTKGAKPFNGVKIAYSINRVGKTGQTYAKKKKKRETRSPPFTTHKKKLKMD